MPCALPLLDNAMNTIIIRRAICTGTRAGAGIGRQAWLRAMCRKTWRFKSSPAHKMMQIPDRVSGIFYTLGNVNQKVVPFPNSDSTQIFPLCTSMIRLTMDKPMPVPSVLGFNLLNRSKILS